MYSTTMLRSFKLTHLNTIKRLASVDAQAKMTSPAYFRCIEQNPLDHKQCHESQLYIIPSEDHKLIFDHAVGAVDRTVKRNIVTFNEFAVMVRKPAIEVISYMNNVNYSTPAVRYVLYGKLGCGKSMSLIHLLHYAIKKKWLLVHVPWVPMWVRWCKEWGPSQTKKGRIDQPADAVLWLKHFKSQNADLLKTLDLRTTKQYTWTQREVTEIDKPLMEIVEQGINRIKFASDCVAVLLKEIKLNATAGKVQVFVGIHGVNSFFGPTRLTHEDRSPVMADDMTLIHAFKKIIKNDWTNGTIVATVCDIANHTDQRDSHFPRYLLGKEGFELFDPFIPIPVTNFSTQEAHSLLDYYIDRKWIQSDGAATEDGKQQLMFLSGKNPGQLSKICNPW